MREPVYQNTTPEQHIGSASQSRPAPRIPSAPIAMDHPRIPTPKFSAGPRASAAFGSRPYATGVNKGQSKLRIPPAPAAPKPASFSRVASPGRLASMQVRQTRLVAQKARASVRSPGSFQTAPVQKSNAPRDLREYAGDPVKFLRSFFTGGLLK